MKVNQKGFTAIEVAIVVLVIVILCAVGIFIYKSKNSSVQEIPQGMTKLIDGNGATVAYQSLPEGWKNVPDCPEISEISTVLLTPNKQARNCGNRDSGYADVYLRTTESVAAITNCKAAENLKAQNKTFSSVDSYDCKDVVIDGRKGTKQTTVTNEKNLSNGGGTMVEYTLELKGKTIFMASYTDIKSASNPTYLSNFDEFINGLKFFNFDKK